MPEIKQYAYSTDNPETVAVYRQARAERRAYSERVRVACAELGGNAGPLVAQGSFGHPDKVIGLAVDGAAPEGWRIVRGRLEPQRGKAGDPARQWLADHQPPDIRHVLVDHGLPRHSRVPVSERYATHRFYSPMLFEHDGTLWACYEGPPTGDFFAEGDPGACTWTPRKLSEFYAAREAFEAAQQAGAVA